MKRRIIAWVLMIFLFAENSVGIMAAEPKESNTVVDVAKESGEEEDSQGVEVDKSSSIEEESDAIPQEKEEKKTNEQNEAKEQNEEENTEVEIQTKAAQERATPEDELGYIPGQILILYDSSQVSDKEIEQTTEEKEGNVSQTINLTDNETVAVVEISDNSTVAEAVEVFEKESKVAAAQPNYLLDSYENEISTERVQINDQYVSKQWYLDSINIESAWSAVAAYDDNKKVKVAVLDTGTEYTHPDLKNVVNIELSKEVTENGLTALTSEDPDGHGTHVSGIIAASANNGQGIAGVASTENNNIVDLFVVDVFSGEKTTVDYVIKGLNYAVEQGAEVVNMSLGALTDEKMPVFEMACKEAHDKGVTIVCAAGNDNSDKMSIPSDYDSTIGVINADGANNREATSNYGTKKDLSAPGTEILSTYSQGQYVYSTGTSMAAPVVAGTIALMKKKDPDLTPEKIRQILCSTAKDIGVTGRDAETGWGLVDAGAAVNAVDSPVITPSVNTTYQTHVQNIGWQNWVSDGATSGTVGKALRLEGIKIKASSEADIGIAYRSHVQNIGWQNFVENGTLSGTSGKSQRLEAIQIKLVGDDAELYDVFYRTHVQSYGWLGWAKNGESAGTEGYAKRLEGIQISVVPKGTEGYDTTKKSFMKKPTTVKYQVHVQRMGWQSEQEEGAIAGSTGKSLRLEALKVRLTNMEYSGGIKYKTHVQRVGWQNYVVNGSTAGTSGRSLRLEAVQIELTGEVAQHYDIYYRTHVQRIGWTGWAKNGQQCGSQGYSYRLEGIQIRLVKKAGEAPGSTQNVFHKYVSWVTNLKAAKSCSQLVIVSVDNKNYATVSLHTKNGSEWSDDFSVRGRVGSAGIGKQREGDKKTPTGIYRLHTPFGIKSNPGCKLTYTKVNKNHYWGGKDAKYYNRLVDASKVSGYKPGNAEHLISYGKVYNYCLAVGYNTECKVGKGSAIFIHCSGAGATAGCISIPENSMITLLKNLRSGAKVIIDYSDNVKKY